MLNQKTSGSLITRRASVCANTHNPNTLCSILGMTHYPLEISILIDIQPREDQVKYHEGRGSHPWLWHDPTDCQRTIIITFRSRPPSNSQRKMPCQRPSN